MKKNGYFLIADITGYTFYLSQSELEHAQETLQALLELLIAHTKPPLVISRLAGDAVISYGLQDNFFKGQTFIEMIEDTYVAFRRAIELMVLNNTCQCNACTNVSRLDLKFFVHYGPFGIQRLDHHEELVGNDVNLIHRLLKNHVVEKTGFGAYTLYTDAVINQLGLEELTKTMVAHEESYEHLGALHLWVQDMHPVWQAKKDQLQFEIEPADILVQVAGDFPLPVTIMWDLITEPEYRAIFVQSTHQKIINRKEGRLAPGSIYQCYHGDNSITNQIILDWRPFEQMTTEDTTPVPKATILMNLRLTPTKSGTHLTLTCSKARGPWLNCLLCNLVGRPILSKQLKNGMKELIERVDQEIASGNFPFQDSSLISIP